jgi:hypothetical protein
LAKNLEDSEAYKGLATRDQKAAFRVEWATKQAEATEKKIEQLVKKETVQEESRVAGKYMPFKKIWEAEGADRSGYEVTYLYYNHKDGYCYYYYSDYRYCCHYYVYYS